MNFPFGDATGRPMDDLTGQIERGDFAEVEEPPPGAMQGDLDKLSERVEYLREYVRSGAEVNREEFKALMLQLKASLESKES